MDNGGTTDISPLPPVNQAILRMCRAAATQQLYRLTLRYFGA